MPKPLIVSTVSETRAALASLRAGGKTVGLVPTMGSLHEGHVSLFRRARAENDVAVASIFVNPTQFGPNEDFHRYPRPFDADLALCTSAGIDVVFHPSPADIYPDG